MRDTRFRAWNGEAMEYGGFSVHATEGKIVPGSLTRVTEDSPLMQYAGFKDSQGTDIYEGDILLVEMSVFSSDDPSPGTQIVALNPETMQLTNCYVDGNHRVSGRTLCKNNAKSFMVIGNIYENPELISVE